MVKFEGKQTLPLEFLLKMYRKMFEIRRFEEKVANFWALGRLPGLVHLYIGQEAVAVGVCFALRKDDYIIGTHRSHGHCLAKGVEPARLMAEILGKETGYCKGRGGSMHACDVSSGMLSAVGVVGSNVPIAAGAGLCIQVRGTDQVCVCFFGDGATNTGAFHEGLNIAATWKLPVVFVCENNLYAISVCIDKATPVKDLAEKAKAYNIPGIIVNGMDVIAIYNAAREAVDRARSGEGPTFIECKTYRFRGHYEGDLKDGARYRSEEEMRAWQEKCPIKRLKEYLIKNSIATEEDIKAIESEVEKEIEEAARFADESPYPDPSTACDYVFCSLKEE